MGSPAILGPWTLGKDRKGVSASQQCSARCINIALQQLQQLQQQQYTGVQTGVGQIWTLDAGHWPTLCCSCGGNGAKSIHEGRSVYVPHGIPWILTGCVTCFPSCGQGKKVGSLYKLKGGRSSKKTLIEYLKTMSTYVKQVHAYWNGFLGVLGHCRHSHCRPLFTQMDKCF